MSKLFLGMFVVAGIEIYLFSLSFEYIGFFATVLLVFLTAMIGSWQVRKQGLSTLFRLQTQQSNASEAITEGLILCICGVLLITPGFLTDTIGFLGLIPAVRQKFISFAKIKTMNMAKSGNFTFYSNIKSPNDSYDKYYNNQQTDQHRANPDVIDAEYTKKED